MRSPISLLNLKKKIHGKMEFFSKKCLNKTNKSQQTSFDGKNFSLDNDFLRLKNIRMRL